MTDIGSRTTSRTRFLRQDPSGHPESIFEVQKFRGERLSEVGGGNGAERSPPPGIQAQRPAPAHRTHDTTDQWRDLRLRLQRSVAYFFDSPSGSLKKRPESLAGL